MKIMEKQNSMRTLYSLQPKSILVIGDVMLDTYFQGDVVRISPEAPVPVFRKSAERSVLGGAANVASNLIAANQNVSVMAIVGRDETAEKLKTNFREQGVNTDLIISLNRRTTEKTRFLAGNNQQVMRLDVEDTDELSHEECKILFEELQRNISSFDLILISDYMKGLLNYELTQGILQMAKTNGIPVIIDVKDPRVEKYKDAHLLKPNKKELHDLTGMPVDTDEQIVEASESLRERCNCRYVLTTCGSRGMVLVGDDRPYFIESAGKEVFDVTGAGDTTIAYLAACMANGATMREAVDIANIAAGIQVSKVGTSAVHWQEVREQMMSQSDGSVHKLLCGNVLTEFRNLHRDKKIVFTNGCFDILHVGHIRYLQEAAQLGDMLVVGLNSDASVRRLKGEGRPVNPEQDRAELICALEYVDYVAVFDEDTPYELIRIIQPDVLVKGGDYLPEDVIGRDIVEARGGKLEILGFTKGKSTTGIINKIKE